MAPHMKWKKKNQHDEGEGERGKKISNDVYL